MIDKQTGLFMLIAGTEENTLSIRFDGQVSVEQFPKIVDILTLDTIKHLRSKQSTQLRFIEDKDQLLIYFGTTDTNGLPQGLGIQIYADGQQIAGQFLEGQPHGYCIMSMSHNVKYWGQCRNGKMHGQGLFFDGKSTAATIFANGECSTILKQYAGLPSIIQLKDLQQKLFQNGKLGSIGQKQKIQTKKKPQKSQTSLTRDNTENLSHLVENLKKIQIKISSQDQPKDFHEKNELERIRSCHAEAPLLDDQNSFKRRVLDKLNKIQNLKKQRESVERATQCDLSLNNSMGRTRQSSLLKRSVTRTTIVMQPVRTTIKTFFPY